MSNNDININLQELMNNELFVEFLSEKIASIIVSRNEDDFSNLNKDLRECIYKKLDSKCEIIIEDYVTKNDILRKSEQKLFNLIGNMISRYNEAKIGF